MKPPSRARAKPDRYLQTKPDPQRRLKPKLVCDWKHNEMRKLLTGLKKLNKTAGSTGEIDYDFLGSLLPGRKVTEIRSVIETLKAKTTAYVARQVKKQALEEASLKKPIELWTDMASTMTGALEEPISAAFSQILTVSSTEPRSLSNSDPPIIHATDTKSPPGVRTVPFRPLLRPPVPGQLPLNTSAALPVVKLTAATVKSSATRPPATAQVVRQATTTVTVSSSARPQPSTATPATGSCQPQNSGAMSKASAVSTATVSQVPAATKTLSSPHVAAQQPTATTSTLRASSSSAPIPLSSNSSNPVTISPSGTSSSALPTTAKPSPPSPSSSSLHPSQALQATMGRTSKYATVDSPRSFGVKGVVDFEKIYRYLSGVQKEGEKCSLTPMESAVVLDLLYSLPEELPLLDCDKLKEHMLQMHDHLSAPLSSEMAKKLYEDQRAENKQDGKGAGQGQITPGAKTVQSSNESQPQTQAGSGDGTDSNLPYKGTDTINSTNQGVAITANEELLGNQAGAAGGKISCDKGATKEGQVDEQAQTSESSDTLGQSGDGHNGKKIFDKTGLLPLNPFIVPVKLLARKPLAEQEVGLKNVSCVGKTKPLHVATAEEYVPHK